MTSPAKGVVAAGHQLTAEAAADILKNGGNACDAAIAAAWMACVCEPVLASPGGGGFAMVDPGDHNTRLVDFFVQAPIAEAESAEFFAADADFGKTQQTFHIGHGASATPGFVPGLFHLHDQSASMPMADLIAPAAKAARNGIVVTRFQHFLSTVVAPILLASKAAHNLFAPEGDLIPAGGTFKNSGLAELFDLLSTGGQPAYDGDIVSQMLTQQNGNGHLTGADFAGYNVADRAPLDVALGDLAVSLNPPPSAGGVLIAHTLSA
ncbi:MAG: gamma-glutamyltransferase, partial [Aestuariivirgaceae bacterium]